MIKTHRTWKRGPAGKPSGRRAQPCPKCKAAPGEMCFKISGAGYRITLKSFHPTRGTPVGASDGAQPS